MFVFLPTTFVWVVVVVVAVVGVVVVGTETAVVLAAIPLFLSLRFTSPSFIPLSSGVVVVGVIKIFFKSSRFAKNAFNALPPGPSPPRLVLDLIML